MPQRVLSRRFEPWGFAKNNNIVNLTATEIKISVEYDANTDQDNAALRKEIEAVFEKLCTLAMKWYKRDVLRLSAGLFTIVQKGFIDTSKTIADGGIIPKLESRVARFNNDMRSAFDSWLEAVVRHINKVVETWDSRNYAAAKVKAKRGAGMAKDAASLSKNVAARSVNPLAAASALSSAKGFYERMKSAVQGIETKRQAVQTELDKVIKFCDEVLVNSDPNSWMPYLKKQRMKVSSVTGELRGAIGEYELSIISLASDEKKLGTELRKLKKANKTDALELDKKVARLEELHKELAAHTVQLRKFKGARKELIAKHDLKSVSEKASKAIAKDMKKRAIALRKAIFGERTYIEKIKRLEFHNEVVRVENSLMERRHAVRLKM